MAAALAPNAGSPLGGRDRIEVVRLNASEISEETCRELDAIVLLRPDRVGAAGYVVLHAAAQRGALVLVAAPTGDQPALWAEALCRAMGLGWEIGLDPLDSETPVPLAGNQPVPEVFGELTADWESLLRPVRVQRSLAVDAGPGAANILLRLDESPPRPLMLAGDVGLGTFVLLAAALDPRWTNLPTKPIWLPLLHEMVRSTAGRRAATGTDWICGDAATLDNAWAAARRLRRFDDVAPLEIALPRSADGTARPPVELHTPGVYVGDPGTGPLLAVNVPPDAGDTSATGTDVVERWLEPLGRWQWLDPARVAQFHLAETSQRDMTAALLVAALLLVLLEMCLARWFSHPPGPLQAIGAAHG